MIKLKLCDNKSYIIQMLPDSKIDRGKVIFNSSFGNICSNLFPDSYFKSIFVWGVNKAENYKVVEAYNGNLKRDLKLYELWAESINERLVICLS